MQLYDKCIHLSMGGVFWPWEGKCCDVDRGGRSWYIEDGVDYGEECRDNLL